MRRMTFPLRFRAAAWLALCISLASAAEPTELERLWLGAMDTNAELKAAEAERKSSLLNRQYASSLYAPSVSVSAANSVAPDSSAKDTGSVYDYSTASLSYAKPFTGGLSVSAATDYEIDRIITPSGTVAAQSPSLSVSASHSLLPWWAQGIRKDPLIGRLDNALRSREIAELKRRRDLEVQIALDYLELRNALRSRALLERTRAVGRETLSSYRELLAQGAIDNATVWDQSQTLMDDTIALEQSLAAIEGLREKLRSSCGLVPVEDPAVELPAFEAEVQTNLEKEGIDQKIEAVGIERALRRQSGAPKISLSLKCSWLLGTEREKDWDEAWSAAWEDRLLPRYTVTLGFDLSPLFSGAAKRDQAIDDAALTALFAKRESSVNSYEMEDSIIEARLRSAERQVVLYREAAEQTRLLLEDAEMLASRGGLTVLEIETYRNQSLRREIEAQNAQDQLWYWRWIHSRRGR